MAVETTTDVSELQGVEDGGGNTVPAANDAARQTLKTGVAIDATGAILELDTRGKRVLDLAVDGSASADYALDASPDGSTWFTGFDTFSSATTIRATYRLGFRYVRLRVTTAASGGATADVAAGGS